MSTLKKGEGLKDPAANLKKRLQEKLGEDYRMKDEQYYSEDAWYLKQKALKAAYRVHRDAYKESEETPTC